MNLLSFFISVSVSILIGVSVFYVCLLATILNKNSANIILLLVCSWEDGVCIHPSACFWQQPDIIKCQCQQVYPDFYHWLWSHRADWLSLSAGNFHSDKTCNISSWHHFNDAVCVCVYVLKYMMCANFIASGYDMCDNLYKEDTHKLPNYYLVCFTASHQVHTAELKLWWSNKLNPCVRNAEYIYPH